ncbi:MAG: DNA repair exonuclease [Desulfarculaceae bacterium]|nr:DNA repair exonuclease [Desulfarculaceae bacterium]MCF8049104.1 DNA repair exonuclease [Desulfarculaceae bacterium]MCF8066723.1 DNA repair exonuclease [Desulfarculaceae bacterium]MCF8099440.1 DNA repair exonuclease [Desulfarculaceae bacterium]MCF8122783.1 DNA repair exonuclease [Desulfarculaceae bacterium]
MTTTRILLAADLHLGGPVAAPDPALTVTAAQARGTALERLVELSRLRQVGLVLLPGDVFHAPEPPLGAVLALQKALAAWSEMGAKVFIAPGNHDPWLPGGVWASWPATSGLTVFGPEAQGVELAQEGLWVAGMAHATDRESRDLSQLLPPPPPGRTGLAVLHANIASAPKPGDHDPYAPAALQNLLSGPFALWALGHIHIPQELGKHPRVLYAGTPQGAHLGETGPKGAWLLELAGGALSAEFINLAPLMFHDLVLDNLMGLESPAALVARVREAIESPASPWPQEHCLRLKLAGPSPLWRVLGREEPGAVAASLKRELGLAGLVLDMNTLCPPADPQTLATRPDVLGRTLALMAQAGQDDEALAALDEELAKSLHPDQRRLPPEERRAWLKELLDEARSLALRGLWQGGGENNDAA